MIPSFHGLLGTRGLQTRSHRPKKKKRLHFKSLALLKHARLTSQCFFNMSDFSRYFLCLHHPVSGAPMFFGKSGCEEMHMR